MRLLVGLSLQTNPLFEFLGDVFNFRPKSLLAFCGFGFKSPILPGLKTSDLESNSVFLGDLLSNCSKLTFEVSSPFWFFF